VKFLRNLFGRRQPTPPPPLIDRREWNEDWQRGDLAECVADYWNGPPPWPAKGHVYRVSAICEGRAFERSVVVVGLALDGLPAWWRCTAFRKLRPTVEPASDEFTAELRDRLHKPAREPAA
jgi:hypothetical protein